MDAYCSSAGITKVRPKPRWQPALFLQEEKLKRFVDLMQKGNEFAPIQVQEIEDEFHELVT
jgi:hypothetical protein